MRRYFILVIGLVCLALAANNAFAQANNAAIGGVVTDSTKALIPGVTVTLTNTATGVTETRLTNDSGAYNFPSVPPGPYKMQADLTSFRPATQNNVEAGVAAQLRVDFVLQLGNAPGAVVSVAGDSVNNPIQESSASVGTTLSQTQVQNLPILGNNVLDLLNVLPGFRLSPVLASASTVGGLNLDTINTTINGMTTNSSRDAASFFGPLVLTTTVVNPDLVGEIRLILAPVDVELGHGNSQVQISTRSGTNKFTGAANWVVRNTALNANTWTNNHTPTLVNGVQVSNKTTPNWSNVQEATVSYGGPIIKNKTFFFALYDQQFAHSRGLVSNVVLTDQARNGIFRYFTGWNPLNAAGVNPTSFANNGTGSWIAVDNIGNPVAPPFNPDGTPFSGQLNCFSIFGNVKVDGTQFTQNDCPGGTAIIQPAWDPRRPGPDSSGYIQKLLSLAPHANNFTTQNSGDGLNTAVNRYLRTVNSGSAGGDVFGTATIGSSSAASDAVGRKQINLKIDHQINNNNRLSVQYTYESDSGTTNVAPWENGYSGHSRRKPALLTVNGTSTLSPSLVNEARFGVNYSREWQSPAWADLSDPTTSAAAQALFFKGQTNAANGKSYPVVYVPGAQLNGQMLYGSNFFGVFGLASDIANTSPLWDYSDTIRWSHGKHAFSTGFEYRRPESTGFTNSAYNAAQTGNPAGDTTPPFLVNNTNFTGVGNPLPGFNMATSRSLAQNMIYMLYGSVSSVASPYWIDNESNITRGVWSDVTTNTDHIPTGDPQYGHQERKQAQNTYSFFFKDDYKIMKRLTLNLGIRYDKNQSIYLANGLTNRFFQDGVGLYGVGRPAGNITSDDQLLTNWLRPPTSNAIFLTGYGSNPGIAPLGCQMGVANPNGIPTSNCDPNLKTTVEFVGPGSKNPHDTLVPDPGKFSPAVGFSWQVPFGFIGPEGSTVIRGGFQRTYGQAGSTFAGGLLSGPGGSDSPNATALLSTSCAQAKLATGLALSISDLGCLAPLPTSRAPGAPISLTGRACCTAFGNSYGSYSPDYYTPYTDNYTLSITRNIGSKYTVDARYVRTIGKGLGAAGSFGSAGSVDLNTLNVYHNPELLQALNDTRAGLNSPFFDQMLIGVNLNNGTAGYGAVGTCVALPTGTTSTLAGVGCPAGQILQRGSMQIRRQYAANLANGNYVGVLNSLLGAINSGTTTGLQADPTGLDPATGAAFQTSQRVLRNGCNRLANNSTLPGGSSGFTLPDGTAITPRCFPENFIITNPQTASSIYAANYGYSNYDAGQITFTARPVQGVSIQATYGLSKTLSLPGNGYTDPLNKQLDYGTVLSSLGQDFKANGTVELPIGPNKLVMGNSSGVLARVLEHWQTSFIYTTAQGSPRSMLGTSNMFYANGRPDVVGPWDNPEGHVQWNGNTGNYFGAGTPYLSFVDPQCTNGTVGITTASDPGNFNLSANCTLQGLGKVVPTGTPGAVTSKNSPVSVLPLLQNPLPGNQGNLGSFTMHSLPRWSLDGNLSKNFRISESKGVAIRFDATNILNHPTSGDPAGLGNAGSSLIDTFGVINTKTGNRQFQGSLRLTF